MELRDLHVAQINTETEGHTMCRERVTLEHDTDGISPSNFSSKGTGNIVEEEQCKLEGIQATEQQGFLNSRTDTI